jgi:hypothetical protein
MVRIYSAVNFTIPRPYPLFNPLLAATIDHLRYLLILLSLKIRNNKLILRQIYLKGQCHENSCFWFFHESVSPQPQSIPLGPI